MKTIDFLTAADRFFYSMKTEKLLAFAALYLGVFLNFGLWRHVFMYPGMGTGVLIVFILCLALALSVLTFIFISLLAWPYMTRPVLIVLFLMSGYANYSMFWYGITIDVDMIRNVFETDAHEASELFTFSSIAWIALTGVLPAAGLCFVKLEYPSLSQMLKSKGLALLLGIFALGGIFYGLNPRFEKGDPHLRYMLSPFNYIFSTALYAREILGEEQDFIVLDADIAPVPVPPSGPNLVVFIVGETARAHNFSLNGYARQTNPLLEKEEHLFYFRNATACSTMTSRSVPCMFSAQTRKTFRKRDAHGTQNLLDILKQADYDVLWIGSSGGCKDTCDRVANQMVKSDADSEFCTGDICYDEALAENLETRLGNIRKNTFIVLHTTGSHGPTYHKKYPAAFHIFTPICTNNDLRLCDREEIVNAYDNSIVYTDYFIAKTIGMLKAATHLNTALFYTSDHGESLGEDGVYLHSMPYDMAPEYQKRVPMLLWMSERLLQQPPLNARCLADKAAHSGAASHDNAFHTLLGLSGINSKLYDANLDMLNDCRNP
ncbi:MAG: phosphoethanolamine--lipid A transferase [Zoogloeaceae bacterium]|jgi:lipid A ethanolaminephosphotransferase|nr:phosphoethanolamine--lipid A transferase [Zoogloeaceae bacterium]